MTITTKLLNYFPDTLDENQYSAFLKLVAQFNEKTDILKVNDDELEALLQGKSGKGLGRDAVTAALTALVDKKLISREQKRDEAGKFQYNEIKILAGNDLVK